MYTYNYVYKKMLPTSRNIPALYWEVSNPNVQFVWRKQQIYPYGAIVKNCMGGLSAIFICFINKLSIQIINND